MGLRITRLIFIIFTLVYAQNLYRVSEGGAILFTNIPKKENLNIFKPPSPVLENLSRYDSIIDEACDQYQVDAELIRIIILAESGFNPNARSPRGAIGLMQLMPETARLLNIKNPYNPRQNIFGGVKFFRYLLNLFNGELELALAAYHAGPKIVMAKKAVPAIPETRQYVDFITGRYAPQDRRNRIYSYVTPDGGIFLTNIPR